MAMKKKFLGLAMAAMVAMPATTAFAATPEGYKSIEMGETETQQVQIPVTGSIKNKDGQAPAGRIEVELPTKMAFTVDENGTFHNTTYTVQNKSSNVNIDLSVASFSGGSDSAGKSTGIKLHPGGTITDPSQNYRNEIELKLTNSKDGKSVDLGKFNTLSGDDTKLATIEAGQTNSIVLSGVAGSKESKTQIPGGEDVDTKGASENFNLVFEIKRTK
ncbi:hypothetical protein [Romboutsia timonensis]|uniref:hypothetical protein n=1 Tax=Romboutsia timonensis TaxID=1776391 RepID=UPI0039A05182